MNNKRYKLQVRLLDEEGEQHVKTEFEVEHSQGQTLIRKIIQIIKYDVKS